LQELHRGGSSGENPDRQVAGAECNGKSSQEHAGGERAHRLAGEGVIEQQPEGTFEIWRVALGRFGQVRVLGEAVDSIRDPPWQESVRQSTLSRVGLFAGAACG
jgi:hypothetical protein